jgi:DNA mismatch repair protein MutS
MMAQYEAIKNQNPDCLLFFRLGDFYELFGDDAKEASQLLNITLTARSSGEGRSVRVPMAGVPYHAAPAYIQKLLRAGKKVAVVEQMGDAKSSKGFMKRELVRVITPGTALEEAYLESKSNNYLLAVWEGKKELGFAFADNTTGDFYAGSTQNNEEGFAVLDAELARLKPAEVIVPEGELSVRLKDLLGHYGAVLSFFDAYAFDGSEAQKTLKDHFGVASLEGYGLSHGASALPAAGALLAYLKKTQKSPLSHITQVKKHERGAFMRLDAATQRHLELTANQEDAGKQGTLFEVLDRSVTAAGGRLLKRWIGAPLLDLEAIQRRLDVVEELHANSQLRRHLAEKLSESSDMERAIGRIGCLAASARDLGSVRQTLDLLPGLIELLRPCKATALARWSQQDPLDSLRELLNKSVVENPPLSIRDGGMIRAGYSQELDQVLAESHGGRDLVLEIQTKERLRSANPKLKVQFNSVFGFYIEISKSQSASVPADYERKQTLVNAERYTTPELKAVEQRVFSADERRRDLELKIFEELRQKIASQSSVLLQLAQSLAELDVLGSLAEVALQLDYVRPELCAESILQIQGGRHPVVEYLMRQEGSATFVANDCQLDTQLQQMMLITGPNMAGKSTYMRQVALLALMAQLGSFVPAKKARIGIVDQLFTRVGASDRLNRGMSTFLVEMTETANILRHATARSLVVLDEIGRGTSTYDGVSIAWAVAEYLHDAPQLGCRTLFATHYFELTQLEKTCPRIQNFSVAVREREGKIIFQHQIRQGSSEHSYGVAVAKLAGVPEAVLARAREVLSGLENISTSPPASPTSQPQMDLFSAGLDKEQRLVLNELLDLEVDSFTPIQALKKLDEFQRLLKRKS